MKHQKLFHIRALIKRVNLKQLSYLNKQEDQQIGIITEKHLQKDLALKGITIEKFKLLNKNLLILHQNDQGQERSVITSKNQIDLLILYKWKTNELYIISDYGFVVTFSLTEKLKKILDSNYLSKTIFRINQMSRKILIAFFLYSMQQIKIYNQF